MTIKIPLKFTRKAKHFLLESLLACRALLFIGFKYTCPCCGWNLRAFTWGGTSMKLRPLGYCPRCNSKARQRRLWLFLETKTNIYLDHLNLLYIAPNYCFSRRFMAMKNLVYVHMDYTDRLYERIRPISPKIDLTALPFSSNSFDAIICQHVLEHIHQDRKSMREIFRVLKPGGWACISSPNRWDQNTFEDPTITDPEERKLAFGEMAHVRIYGWDLPERLEESGFHVQLDSGKDIEKHIKDKYGLKDDEDIFYCTKF